MSPRQLKNRPVARRRVTSTGPVPREHLPDVEAVGAAFLVVDGSRRVLSSSGWEGLLGSPAPERIPERGEAEDDLLEGVGEAVDRAWSGDAPVHRVARMDVDRGRFYFISAGPPAGSPNGGEGERSGRAPVLVMEITAAFGAGPKEGEEIRQMAHDLRSPLTSMSGAVELLQSGRMGRLNPEQDKLLSLLNRGIAMMLDLIDKATEQYRRAAGILPGLGSADEPSQKDG